MYTVTDFKSKAALKAAVAAGDCIEVFQPNGDLHGSNGPYNGDISVEGPHYPRPHTWYARVRVSDSVITKVIS